MLSSTITSSARNEILARGIPALSGATGGTAVFLENFRFDMNNKDPDFKPNNWGRNHSLFGQNWMHGDLKDMAFFYNFKLFEDVVRKGASK